MSQIFSINRITATNIFTWRKLDLAFPKSTILGIQGGNFTGKSNLIDIILIALYNRTVRSHVKSSWVTDGEKNWSVTLDFHSGSLQCQIIRGSRVNSLRVGSTTTTGVSAVNEKLSEILKCSFSQFINVSYLGQNRLSSVASSTDSDRRSLLEPLSNLPDFKLLKNQARYDSSNLGKQLSVFEDRISRLERQIEKATTVNNRDLQELNDKRSKILLKLEKDQIIFNKTKALVSKLDASVDDLSDTLGTLELHVQEHETKIEHFKSISLILNSASSRCPSCFSIPTSDTRKEALKFTKEQIEIHKNYRDKFLAEKTKQNNFKKLEMDKLLKAKKVKKELRYKFINLTSDLKNINKDLKSLNLNKDLKSLKKLLEVAKKGRSSCHEDLKYSDFWEKSLNSKGLPSYLMKNVVKSLSSRVTSYLNDILSGVRINFFHSEDNGAVKCEIISKNGNTRGFFACSGAERRLIDLACSFAMRDIAAEKYGSVSDFLILDEIFDSLDEAHLEGVQQWLTKLKGVTVLLISHNQTMKDWLPEVRTVKYTEKLGSYFA